MIKEYGTLNNRQYVLTSNLTFSSLSTAQCFVSEDQRMDGMNGKIKTEIRWIQSLESN